MIELHRLPGPSPIRSLKADYLRSLTAPMDGMWDTGLTEPAPHWEIRADGERAGYFAADDDGRLLQFYLRPAFEARARALFAHVVAQAGLSEAVVSTIDPACLSLCLDLQRQVTVHTYLYELVRSVEPARAEHAAPDFRRVSSSELDRAVAFQESCTGEEHDPSGWQREYSANLIERGELFVLCRDDDWLGLGECRRSASQAGIADLGMMVAPAHRRAGWATEILIRLGARCASQGLRAICSTTADNVGAQKAIERSGFVSRHRIVTVSFG